MRRLFLGGMMAMGLSSGACAVGVVAPGGPLRSDTGSAATSQEAASTADASSNAVTSSSSGAGGATASASSSGSGGSSSGGGNPAFNLVNCTGPASASGSVANVKPSITMGTVQPDPSGNVKVVLLPKLPLAAGDVVVGVYFFAKPGQYSYPPNGSVGCAVLKYNGSGYTAVDKSSLCEVKLSKLTLASAPNTCDGVISGTFDGVFTGNQPLAGSFALPLAIANSQLKSLSCQPYDGPCSQHSDCCSKSCSIYIGVCN